MAVRHPQFTHQLLSQKNIPYHTTHNIPYHTRQNIPLLISFSSDPMGVEGVAGTDEALRRRLDDRKLRFMAGSSFRSGLASSKISRSTRPEYRNLVPHEKKLPPVTTDGASELDGNLQTNAAHIDTAHSQFMFISAPTVPTHKHCICTFQHFFGISIIQ
jgi:hypothetical protein